jgi:protease-4
MNQFIKQTFASLIGSLAALLLLFGLGASGFVLLFITLLSQDIKPKVEDKSVLVFDLSAQITDRQSAISLRNIIGNQSDKVICLRQVLEAIDKAAKDQRIVGILLAGGSGKQVSGYATLTEVRNALSKFSAAGKKIIAYNVNWSEGNYYLASIADKIVVNPMGDLVINGFGTEQLFLTGALEKYGVGVQVIRAGKYKAAVEPFTRKNLSPESRNQTQELLSDLWGNFKVVVGAKRKLTPQKIQNVTDQQGMMDPKTAKELGLVDQLGYFDEIITELKEITGKKKDDEYFTKINLKEYINASSDRRKYSDKIAIVYAEGTIVNGEGNTNSVGSETLVKDLRKIRYDKDTKAVVLRINSPGGSATASEIILRELQLISKEKPVIVSMGNVAASGGYWIATAAEKIFAQKTTITGSIGVFGLFFNFNKIAKDNGLSWDVVKTGRYADINSSYRPKSPAEIANYQKYVDQTYDLFIQKVAKSRKLSEGKVMAIAQGRVWSGEDAKKIGLVDEIGGIEDAIEYAAKKAKLSKKWQIKEYPEESTIGEKILGKVTETELKQDDLLTRELVKIKDKLSLLQTLNDPRGIYIILPFDLIPD